MKKIARKQLKVVLISNVVTRAVCFMIIEITLIAVKARLLRNPVPLQISFCRFSTGT
ncbi:MAG TPA: hypothetical protein VK155_10735 [Bacteroidales bacterium]|jgi:hypothetical protein|nr:hypothetical protein [Bacteroidales bacterium]